jgi:hydroxypyruvate isomerase
MRHVVIMGPMGVGKSTTGRALAEHLGWAYSDSDDEIERAHGASGREIAARDGVAALHRIEAAALLDALGVPNPSVITAAASTIESPEVRRALSVDAMVAVLTAPTLEVLERQAAAPHRRSMSSEEYEELAQRREPWFRSVEDVRLSALRPTAELTTELVERLDHPVDVRFSANLGFLWTDQPLPDAIRVAADAGFDAVECHAPFAFEADDVRAALDDTGLPLLSLNTRAGSRDGDYGLAAMPGREDEARVLIDEALEYAEAVGCRHVHVLAGRSGSTPAGEATYRSNLAYAAERAGASGRRVLIEPLNSTVADYHLLHIADAVRTIEAVGADNLRIMIDCFHSRMMDGDLDHVFDVAWPHVGHIQISAYPDRGEPVGGEIDYDALLPSLAERGWAGPFGAEYTPRHGIEAGLGWLEPWHARRRNK